MGAEAERKAERIAEAIVFASAGPVAARAIAERLPAGTGVEATMARLAKRYADGGVNLVRAGDAYAFRTAADLSWLLRREEVEVKKLSRAALEVLAIIAYHQPTTRAEIEEIRGVSTSKGTLDVLLETGWVRIGGRRQSPGRPVTYATTPGFLDHFSLSELADLPGIEELKGAGLLSAKLPPDFSADAGFDEDASHDDGSSTASGALEDLGLLPPGGEEG
ncbi:SMC-Scp complex subunit ScpB [Pararhizobium mangrovi]|uniref:SMC-Scp complex subunit ScpB n=1 Tax=Pararhizobium mangrovi TaxID=2590452 RepID=UPI0015E86006|nr:SMC-Scp complex subunit ScpB [Pararhizobium mangrovi]